MRSIANTEHRRLEIEADNLARDIAFLITGYRCLGCLKKSLNLDPHHLLGRRTYPKIRFDLHNIIPLCRLCHQTAHSRIYDFERWLEAHYPGRMEFLRSEAKQSGYRLHLPTKRDELKKLLENIKKFPDQVKLWQCAYWPKFLEVKRWQ